MTISNFFKINQRIVGFGYFVIKKPLVSICLELENCGFELFQKLQRISIFHERINKVP